MTLKEAAANSLLAFVASTCVVLIVRAVDRPAPTSAAPEGSAGPTPAPQTAATASPAAATPDGVHVYYLHGNIRCPTCRSIEAYTKEAVETGFARELQSGKVTWQVINFDQPGNRHYQTQYKLIAPTVVVAKWQGGKQVDWRNLNEVWEYVSDKPAFLAFVQNHVREFLGQPTLAAQPARGNGPFAPTGGDRVLPVPEPLGLEPTPPGTWGSGNGDLLQAPGSDDLPVPPTKP